MNGYELVRKQPQQDSEISKRLPLTGGTLTGNLTMSNNSRFIGNLNGNATTATTLQNARTLNIGNTGKSFNGSSNVSWSLNEIGAVNKTGDTMSGDLTIKKADGSAAAIMTHRTVNGNDIQARFDVFLSCEGSAAISTNNKTSGNQLSCYVCENTGFWASHTSSNNVRPTLGWAKYRWSTIYSINALNTSDMEYKENIEYLQSEQSKKRSLNNITYKDLYNFYKDIELAKYNYKGQEHNEFGFIAQDIINTKVGSEIVIECEEGHLYSIGSYASSIAGALKHSISEIENLKQENLNIKKQLEDLSKKLDIVLSSK